jgi:hypothetical protein
MKASRRNDDIKIGEDPVHLKLMNVVYVKNTSVKLTITDSKT